MTAFALLLADSGWDNHMGDWGAGWWIVMMLMMVVFWGLVIVGVVWLVRSLTAGHHRGHHDDPLAVLDHRLASGDISIEEYRQRRELLGKGGGSDGA
jgi:putative membrane protein